MPGWRSRTASVAVTAAFGRGWEWMAAPGSVGEARQDPADWVARHVFERVADRRQRWPPRHVVGPRPESPRGPTWARPAGASTARSRQSPFWPRKAAREQWPPGGEH